MEVKTLNLKIYKVYELTKDIIYYASCACVCVHVHACELHARRPKVNLKYSWGQSSALWDRDSPEHLGATGIIQ